MFTKRLLLREYTGVVNNPSSTKLSYSKLKNAVLNPSKSFLALKKVSPRILSTFKRSFSKKMGKTPSHIIHSPGGEYLTIETLRSRFGHFTANDKRRFAVNGFTLPACQYLELKIREWWLAAAIFVSFIHLLLF